MLSVVEIRPGTQLAVDDGGTGPVVVFLHGLSMFKEIWNDSLRVVRENGFRAIAYDQRGHGESSDPPPPWSIADLAADLAALLDKLSIRRVCLVGHSMGARCAFQFCLTSPGHVWAVVSVDGHSEAPRNPYRETLNRVRTSTDIEGLSGFRREFESMGEIPTRCSRDEEFRDRFNHFFCRNRRHSLIAALDAIMTMQNLTPRLGEIQVPALSIVGEHDSPFLDLAKYYERAMPCCRTFVVPQCGHDPVSDEPGGFTEALLEFLNKHRRSHFTDSNRTYVSSIS